MSITHTAAAVLNRISGAADLTLLRRSTFERRRLERVRLRRVMDRFQIDPERLYNPSSVDSALPEGAEAYLRIDNPRLKELKQEYKSLNHPGIDHSEWTEEYVNERVNLRYFRGDSGYVWQPREFNTEIHYLLTTYYIKSIDRLGLLSLLGEDDLFGMYTVKVSEELTVSPDLLDSIVEIYFLERTLGISTLPNINILDIGAGYGRLAHRIVNALPEIGKVFCVDAVAESTFICEYYLRFQGVHDRATVVPLHEIEDTLANNKIHIAVNVHSFSACNLASISWWLDLLAKHKVRYLMVVPNAGRNGGMQLTTTEKDRSSLDFLKAINSRGYDVNTSEPKYLDPSMHPHGVTPTYYYLFELTS